MADKSPCPVCSHPSYRHWYAVRKGKLIWNCKDCPGRQCKARA